MEHEIRDTDFNVFDDTDAIIKVQDMPFKVHKIILSGCSPYFRVLFSNRWTSMEDQSYNIPGLSSDTMSLIIQYAYRRRVDITEENVPEVLEAADQFLISGLIDACCQFLEVNLRPENCIGSYMLTEWFPSCSTLLQKTRLYVLQHFEEAVQASEEFLELPLGHLEQMIGRDELNVKKEEVVFEAIIRWIGHAPEERRKHIDVLLSKVRMGLMSPDYFMTNVRNSALVLESEACSEIIINAMKVIYDKPGSSELAKQLARPRLPYEILLAFGGWNKGYPAKMEAYNARADCWVSVTPKDALPRNHFSAVVLEGFVYCLGELGSDYTNSVRKFNPITRTCQEVAPLHERRWYASVAVLDGLIYAIGGCTAGRSLKTVERYDANTNQWTMIASMNEWRSEASATALQGKVYICGGFNGARHVMTAESFNPETNQWSLIAPMRSRRSSLGVISYGNLIYAVGGYDGAASLRSAEAYNPLNNTWHDIRSMRNPRSHFGIEVVDDQLVVAGGCNRAGVFRGVERYDRKTNEWGKVCSMSFTHRAVTCCVISGLPDVTQYVVARDDESDSD